MRDRIMVDVHTMDDKPIHHNISHREAFINIYKRSLKLDKENLHGICMEWQGHPVIVLRTVEPIDIDKLPKNFSYVTVVREGNEEVEHKYSCEVRGVRGKDEPQNDGPITRWIKITGTAYNLNTAEIMRWLELYGNPLNAIKEEPISFPDEGAESDDENLEFGSGTHSVQMKIHHTIPQYLPAFGRKVKIYYRGIETQCTNCYETGHIRASCQGKKISWIDYVKWFREDNPDIKDEMYGRWLKISERDPVTTPQPETNTTSTTLDETNRLENEARKSNLLKEIATAFNNTKITEKTDEDEEEVKEPPFTDKPPSPSKSKRGRPKKSKE